ncbi:DUF664 domain-containing protein [Ktedonosporobacter rubrisoli]|uniref:DUF664 domain-containing protein n=1 Tax=Ktedonosporobacter rubrisoli TaxID=2509675 RepID=A0A4P6K0I1_KTERU|nr:DinB family protein [Ktedonosporobacter rubrisoli]QBD81292.1 DUF664 domain-containing protein [Ktedonosporobacter rubrisoli]
MAEQASPLVTFYKLGWENHHQALVKTIAQLSAEQLANNLVAAHYISIGELLAHMIAARITWFCGWMGEGKAAREQWHEVQSRTDPAELIAIFEKTWQVISSAMDRWTSTDLEQLILPPASHQAWLRAKGLEEEPPHTRQWIIWHVLEHEIHHGGELSLALGTHGLDDFYTW